MKKFYAILIIVALALCNAFAVEYESLVFDAADLTGNRIIGPNDTSFSPGSEGFMSEKYISNKGLANRVGFANTFYVDSVPFTIQSTGSDFDGNDCIYLVANTKNTSCTYEMKTIGAYKDLYVLATLTGVGNDQYADFSVQLNFTDGTNTTYTYKLYDWCYRSLSAANVATKSLTKTSYSNGITSKPSTQSYWNALVQSYHISGIEKTKLIKSMTFTYKGMKYISNNSSSSSTGTIMIFGITGIAGSIKAPSISLSSVSGTTAKIGWSAVSGASSYRLDVSTTSDFTSILTSYNNLNIGKVTSYSITGLTAGSTYYARVRAVNSDNEQSISSNVITIPVHKHSWNYVSSGTTLKSYCSGTVGKDQCSYQGSSKAIEVSINVPDFVHAGDSYDLVTDESTWNNAGCASITKQFTGTMEGTSYSSATVPKKRGNYTLTISAGGKSASKSYEINHVWTYTKDKYNVFATCTYDNCQYKNSPVNVKLATNIADLGLTLTPSDATDSSIVWESSDTNVATVNKKGHVLAHNEGTAEISVKPADGGGKLAKLRIAVTKDGINIPEFKDDSGDGNGGSGNNSDVVYTAANTISSAKTESGKTYSSSTADTIALLVNTSSAVTVTNPTVTKTGNSDGGDNCNFYGQNAAVLVKGGSTTTITGGTVTSNATGANGVFSYGGNGGSNGAAGDGTKVIISGTTINTTGSGSGGIMTTGGGVTQASNLTITTSGESSAAIRTDRGGGTVTVDGGSYTTSGLGSPAIYCTADITVSNATLTSNLSEGICIEGKNSVTLNNCTLEASNTQRNGNAKFKDTIMIYQSMSGDSSTGTATFSMTGGNLTSNNGHVFHVTNTAAVINLEDVTITNNDTDNVLLSVCDDGWSGASNTATLNATSQALTGKILVGSNSSLTINLYSGSTCNCSFSGAITNDAGSTVSTSLGTVTVNVYSGASYTGSTAGITVVNK